VNLFTGNIISGTLPDFVKFQDLLFSRFSMARGNHVYNYEVAYTYITLDLSVVGD